MKVTDREFLMWIHERLELVHGEDRLLDYMHCLRGIIKATPKDKTTANLGAGNSLDELKQQLIEEDA